MRAEVESQPPMLYLFLARDMARTADKPNGKEEVEYAKKAKADPK